MKKILALLLSLGGMTAVFAQNGHDDRSYRNESRDVIVGQHGRDVYNNGRSNDPYYYSRQKDEQIARINRYYDNETNAIKWDRRLRNSEKRRQIRYLESQRQARIREVNLSYADRGYGNRTYRTGRY